MVASRLKHDVRYYLGKLWFDAVAYGSEELEFVAKVSRRAEHFGVLESVGISRLLFGTDYPFFPPLNATNKKWPSVVDNLNAIEEVGSWSQEEKDSIRGANAIGLFELQ
jgi:predicted TIM-barrel fold metal-dependent hydrolase